MLQDTILQEEKFLGLRFAKSIYYSCVRCVISWCMQCSFR